MKSRSDTLAIPDTLPDKPSELIRLAIADLEKIEADSKYKVDMSEWHYPISGTRQCCACFAGAVMAGQLDCNAGLDYQPQDFVDSIYCKLKALDALRSGEVIIAMNMLGLPEPIDPDFPTYHEICHYEDSSLGFKNDLLELATELERYSL